MSLSLPADSGSILLVDQKLEQLPIQTNDDQLCSKNGSIRSRCRLRSLRLLDWGGGWSSCTSPTISGVVIGGFDTSDMAGFDDEYEERSAMQR